MKLGYWSSIANAKRWHSCYIIYGFGKTISVGTMNTFGERVLLLVPDALRNIWNNRGNIWNNRYLKCYLFYLLCTLLCTINFDRVVAQEITTVAGGGTTLGDGGPATNAEIIDPSGCTFDKNRNLFVVSSLGGNRIRKIDSNWTISTFAGIGTSGYSGDGGAATNAELNIPVDLKTDSFGRIFFSDAGNNVIRKIDTNGIITTIVGNGIQGFSGDGGPAILAKLYDPNCICFDIYGNLYIGDAENNRIRKVDTSGIISTFAGTGIYGYSGDGGQATLAQIWLPAGITSDKLGNVYIADRYRIRKVNTLGIISTFAGNGVSSYIGDGIPATTAQFSPDWIYIDKFYNLIIGDNVNYRIYVIDTINVFHWIAGSGEPSPGVDGIPATTYPIYYPGGIASDQCGNLFVTEISDRKIRKITFDSTCSSITKISELESNNNFTIYPNPCIDEININNATILTSYTILNISGIIEQTGILKEGSNQLNINILPPGLYLLQLISDKGEKVVRKFVKSVRD